MKTIAFVLSLLPALCAAAPATPEQALAALWRSLSHAPGQPADTAALRALFHPDAMIYGMRYDAAGAPSAHAMPAARFADGMAAPRPQGFYECEVARELRQYDRFATAYSVVESRSEARAGKPDFTGVNGILLQRGDDGWRILALSYQVEKAGLPVGLAGGRSGVCLGAS